MKKTMIKTAGILAMTSILLLSACQPAAYTEKEETKVLENLVAEAIENPNPIDFEKLVKADIDRISEEGKNELVDAYVFTVFQQMNDMTQKIGSFTTNLEELEVDLETLDQIEVQNQIEDPLFKTFVEEVHKKRLVIRESANGTFAVQPNFEYIFKEFGDYMGQDMYAYLKRTEDEMGVAFYDNDKGQMDLAMIADRIVSAEKLIAEFPESVYRVSFEESRAYYYEVYLGVNHEILLSEDAKVKEEVFEAYEEHAETFKDTQFGEDLKRIVLKLKEAKLDMNPDVTAVISEIISERTPIELKEEASLEQEPAEEVLTEETEAAIDSDNE